MKNTRKCIVFLLVLSMLTTIVPTAKAQAAAKPKTTSHAYYMIDAGSGKKILSSNANKRIYPASTVKLLTALTVLEYSGTDEEIKYTKKNGSVRCFCIELEDGQNLYGRAVSSYAFDRI